MTRRKYKLLISVIILIGFIVVFFGYLKRSGVNFFSRTNVPTEKGIFLENEPPLVLGVLGAESPKDTLLRLNHLRIFLEKELNKPVRIEFSSDFLDLVNKIKDRRLDLLLVDPATYCELKAIHKQRIYPLVIPEGGEGEISSVFITRHDSGIERIFDGVGKRLALGDERSSFNYLIPLSMLRDLGIDLKEFSKVGFLGSDKRIILSVLLREYDIGAVSESIAKIYLNQGSKIIKSSEKVPSFVIVITDNMKDREKILKNLFIHRTNEEVLKSLKIRRFKPAEDRDFDYIRVLIKLFKGKNLIEYPPNTIKVAILPLYSPLTIYRRFDPLMKYLSEKTGYEFKLVIPRDFEEFVKIVKNQEVHFSYQNPYVYALLSREKKVKAINITVGEDCVKEESDICGGDKFRGVIIVRSDSEIKDLKDLRGRKILIVSPYSAGGFLSQKIYLEKKGFNLYRDFRIIDVKRQEKVIIGVYKGLGEAGFVRESALGVFGKEIDLSKIKILAYTETLPNWPFAVVRASPELTKTVQTLLSELKDDYVLKNLRIKEFRPAKDEDFKELKNYIR